MNFDNMIGAIQISATILGIVATISTAIIAICKVNKSRKYECATYYVARGVFADRAKCLNDLINLISSNSKIINVFGKRGIGKSSFLRFFCDFTNKKLKKENSKKKTVRRGIKAPHGRAFYIEISSFGNQSIEAQILSQMADKNSTLAELANQTAKRLKWNKKIFIVIDNISNNALSRELESIIDVFLSHSKKYFIIVGSIEKQPFLNTINEKNIDFIELEVFEDSDIFEFASKNKVSVPLEYISKVISFSDGLPIFVSLLLANPSNELGLIHSNDSRIDKYLSRIIGDLNIADAKLAQYIGFLSITNVIIPISLIRKFNCLSENSNLEVLENNALIEIDSEKYTVKMHELFRNYICKRYLNSVDVIEDIYQYYVEQDMMLEKIYYLIMIDVIDKNKTIIEAIESGVKNESFSFLLLFGEHYKRTYDWKHINSGLDEETFLHVIYGYIEGLIGVGNYPAAREVIDKCKISARTPKSEIQFKFSLTTAQLYHLQNNYEEAIATYQILLNYINENVSFQKYETTCFWGIAHSLRHGGYDLNMAIEYYNKSINSATMIKSESEAIKSMREKLFIYMLRNNKVKAKQLYESIKSRIAKLPEIDYMATHISFLKSKVTYKRIMSRVNTECEYKLLERAIAAYENNKKRLQYNIYFEFGEHYRKLGKNSNAAKYYHKALAFSRRNKDHNLETLSLIALIVNDISRGYTKETLCNKYKQVVIQIYGDTLEYNLHINGLLADMILSFISNSSIDNKTYQEFERIGYYSAINLCKSFESTYFVNLDLFLM